MLSYNNAISLGYGKEYLDDKSADHEFRICVHSPTGEVRDVLSEMKKNAIEIAKNGKPILCLSGGLDSEVMGLAFIAAQVDFEAVIIRFNENLNIADTKHAEDFCKENDITFRYIDVDIVQFFESGKFQKIVDEYKIPSPEIAAQIFAFRQVPGNLVVGGEAFRVFKGSGGEIDYRAVSELEAALIKYFLNERGQGCPNFHFFSPECAWSFFKTSIKNPSTRVEDDHDPLFYQEKLRFYRACGFNVVERKERKIKLHGFEDVKRHFDKVLEPQSSYQLKFRDPQKLKYPISSSVKIVFDMKNPEILKIFNHQGVPK